MQPRLFIPLTVFLLALGTAQAGERVERNLRQRLHDALNLSVEQKTQLQQLRVDFRQQLQALRAQVQAGELKRQDAREQVHTLRQTHRDARNQILTQEQQALVERAHQHIKEQREANGDGDMGPNDRKRHHQRRARILNALDLSDEQKAQLRELRQENRQQLKALHEAGQRPTAEQRQEMAEARRTAFEAILTADQLEQLNAIRARLKEARHGQGDGDGASLEAPLLNNDNPPSAVEDQTWGKVKSQMKK